MQTIKTEGAHAGEFLLSEAPGTRSRDEGVLAPTTADLPAGQVLGVVTADSTLAPYDPVAVDGTETAAAILFNPKPASAEAQRATLVVRDAEVIDTRLTGLDAASEADLLTAGIVVRSGTP